MAAETRVQEKLIKYLKSKGCYVIKTRPGTGIPVGCPDVFAFKEGFWAAFEVKASASSPYRVLQKETMIKLADWSFARRLYPENFQEVISELEQIL